MLGQQAVRVNACSAVERKTDDRSFCSNKNPEWMLMCGGLTDEGKL